MDIVVRDGSGAGRALAAGPDSSPAATIPAVTPTAQVRRPVPAALVPLVPLVLNLRKRMGP
ncbi:hypothetical protein GCM10010266_61620 [Streptomyces griseomycini]|nr:hypothetical protein GCM10010266_61620 [Streptomyces griseomycini]GGR49352.1 hypothetical protein GCM10015536_63760 [Streptomyces griseomycini]